MQERQTLEIIHLKCDYNDKVKADAWVKVH